ncbi:MAG: ABC transporter permease [Chloroflexi bacterium]|nr:ABC transporter permease [Chloroflexota bacterium]MCL5110444.1 ABC transporter permease [Chloroflexota bacterium]
MTLMQSLRLAIRALGANKLRTSLTMLGMIIGVSAVIALMSVGTGAQQQITSQIQSMGSNLLFVTPGATQTGGVRQAQGTQPTLTLEDANAITPDVAPAVAAVAPEVDSFAQVVNGPTNVNTRITGVTAAYASVRDFQIAEGDFITDQNVQGRSLVAVLGSNVAAELFPGSDPVGQTVKINRLPFRVVGVLVSKGSQALGNQDDVVLAPITTVQQRLSRQRTVSGGTTISQINVQVVDDQHMQQAVDQIGSLLRERHRVSQDDFTIRSQQDLLATVQQITGVLTLLLGSIAGISLVVGGIGIMNIMLVSVTERTREIGIRKAIGAKRRDILMQFLIESLVVSLVGGATGVLLGTGAAHLISLVNLGGQSVPTDVTPGAVLLATGVSAAVGLFFGLYPANRAAALRPIEALRFE